MTVVIIMFDLLLPLNTVTFQKVSGVPTFMSLTVDMLLQNYNYTYIILLDIAQVIIEICAL